MSKGETKSKSTTTPVKRGAVRPRKSAAKAETKTRIVVKGATAQEVADHIRTHDVAKRQNKGELRLGADQTNAVLPRGRSAVKAMKQPSNSEIMSALEGLKRSFVTEAKSVHQRFDELNDKLDLGIKIFTDIKQDVAKIKPAKKSRLPWRRG